MWELIPCANKDKIRRGKNEVHCGQVCFSSPSTQSYLPEDQQCGLTGKSACQAEWIEFNPQNPHSVRKELTPTKLSFDLHYIHG